MSKKKNITLFHPFDFKKQFVDFLPNQNIGASSVNEFFIHALDDQEIQLKLPLPPHKKTVNDFFIVFSGYAIRQVGITEYRVGPNELLTVPKLHVSTTDFYSDNLTGFYCHFSDEFVADHSLLRNWQSNTIPTHKILLDEEAANRMRHVLTIINTLYQSNYAVNKPLIVQYLRTILTEINLKNPHVQKQKSTKREGLAEDYIQLIHSNLDTRYRIVDLANMLNVSPNHLNKLIKKQVGKSAQSVYNEITLQEAQVLLLQTSKDVGEIAFDLGFSDASYFGKFFKKMTQLSPLEYRKKIEKYQ